MDSAQFIKFLMNDLEQTLREFGRDFQIDRITEDTFQVSYTEIDESGPEPPPGTPDPVVVTEQFQITVKKTK